MTKQKLGRGEPAISAVSMPRSSCLRVTVAIQPVHGPLAAGVHGWAVGLCSPKLQTLHPSLKGFNTQTPNPLLFNPKPQTLGIADAGALDEARESHWSALLEPSFGCIHSRHGLKPFGGSRFKASVLLSALAHG